ncbi:cisplatin damage response ATP-dependent DNA ligase [Inquilinus sp. CAU 1745]|uniref:cisplatin damage response ATP-dependent DNA ligase n=1 Tax=Inquilinus sp. CAU 1745 TaxID=3140369 RepID=UPI00325BFAEC
MKPFAALIESLVFMPSRNGKLRLLVDYFDHAPDPDRGYALAALSEGLSFPTVKSGIVRALAAERIDPALFEWSYDFVGDLAETVSLAWPIHPDASEAPTLSEVVNSLAVASRSDAPAIVSGFLDAMDPTERFALLKLITGGMRIGVSARLAKTALGLWGNQDVADIEEIWHGLKPPYGELFSWLEGAGPRPSIDDRATFRPLMLANPLEEADLEQLDPALFRAEWKWDGIRIQLVARNGQRRIFSRTGDDVGGAFPDILEKMDFDAVLDGELLVVRDGEVAPFNHLQQRLNRKAVTARMLEEYPAGVRLYDILRDGAEDLRPLPFDDRRLRLEQWFEREKPARMDLSPMVPFAAWDGLAELRSGARDNAIEGLMLKRGDAPYTSGRPKGPWFKWKRGPLLLDAVLMYAQRGHGKRSSFYSDFTFGAWRPKADGDGRELVPVGKAYFGFTDEELGQLDRWVRNNTVNRFGPVREVRPGLVLEVAFDSVHPSARHKSGVAMRFPRVHRIRWDKPADEADELETLEKLIVR